jgi:hypothetical protein
MVKDAWLPAAQDGRIPRLKPAICGEGRCIRRASDQLHGPGTQRLQGRRTSRKESDLRTGQGVWEVHLSRAGLNPGPLLGGCPVVSLT